MKKKISSGAPWEKTAGYSRAIRTGEWVFVAGTTAIKDGEVQGINDPYAQSKCILEIIGKALQEAGSSFEDVVRTRMFVTNIDYWEEVVRAHGEVFADIRPASTLVEVGNLIDPRLLVEIEATAHIQS